jgi:hypothetical protein
MTTAPPWTIRPYRPGDETALAALFARVFGRPISEAHWRWKLTGHAFPVPNVFLGVVPSPDHGDRPVFQYAGIPVRYRGPDGDAMALTAVDAMTDPEFRRQGLLTAVGRHAHDRWREAGASFVIGLPNDRWGSRAAALGWRDLFPLTWRIRPLHIDRTVDRWFGRAAKRAVTPLDRGWNRYWQWRTKGDPTVRINRVTSAEGFDRLWHAREAHRVPHTSFTIVRDRHWIEWRYLSAPDTRYTVWLADWAGDPVGHCVARIQELEGHRVGYIAEFSAVDDDPMTQRMLLTEAAAELSREGAEFAAALAVPGTPAHRALGRAGFLFSWGSFRVHAVPLRHAGVPSFTDVSGGDFDVV